MHEMRSMLAKEEEDFYSSCVACVDQALALYESREWDHSRTDAFLRTIERGVRRRTTELAVAAQVKEVSVEAEADNALWFPKKGDRVKLKRLGGTKATVVGFNKTNQTVTVRKGTITMTCTLGDLSR